MNHLVRGLFPSHQRNSKSSLVLVNQLQFEPLKHLFVVADVVLPNQYCFVSVVTVSEVALAKHMKLLSDITVLDQTLFSVFQSLLFRYFFI